MEGPYRAEGGRNNATPRCLYCGRPREGSRCSGCDAEAPTVPCTACGRAVPAPVDRCVCGARCFAWDAPAQDGLPCPRCGGSLWRVQLDESRVHVEQCSRCLGCFTRTADFSELVSREEAGTNGALKQFVPLAPGRELPRQTLLAPVRCPHCAREMDRARFAQRAAIVIDVCPSHGMWLDAGELVAVLNFVKDRTEGAVPLSQVERVEEEHWRRVGELRAEEERIVSLNATLAESHLRASSEPSIGFQVAAASALGGPWLGLFVAVRKMLFRRK